MQIVPIADVGCHAETGTRMVLPVPTVYVHHQGGGLLATEPLTLQMMQRHGAQTRRGIEYSYLIAPSGTVYAGFGDLVGAHTKGQNRVALGVCFLGNFVASPPSAAALAAMRALLDHLLATDRITAGYRLVAHRDAPGAATICPGDGLYPLIPQMRHDYRASAAPNDAATPTTPHLEEESMLLRTTSGVPSAREPGRFVSAEVVDGTLRVINGAVTLHDPTWQEMWPNGRTSFALAEYPWIQGAPWCLAAAPSGSITLTCQTPEGDFPSYTFGIVP